MIALEVWHGIIDNGSISSDRSCCGSNSNETQILNYLHLFLIIAYLVFSKRALSACFSFPVQLTVSSSLTQLSSSHG